MLNDSPYFSPPPSILPSFNLVECLNQLIPLTALRFFLSLPLNFLLLSLSTHFTQPFPRLPFIRVILPRSIAFPLLPFIQQIVFLIPLFSFSSTLGTYISSSSTSTISTPTQYHFLLHIFVQHRVINIPQGGAHHTASSPPQWQPITSSRKRVPANQTRCLLASCGRRD